MPWYRAGSVTVANGSATVTGAGTDFVGNTQAGEVFLGPDGRVYEISGVQSATQLTIIPNYLGASAGGQAYGIQPTASFARDLALGVSQLLNTFGAVRDGIGQGLIADGTVAAPGIRFAGDQDTGLVRPAPNMLDFVTGGVVRGRFNSDGLLVPGGYVNVAGSELGRLILTRDGVLSWFVGGAGAGQNELVFRLNATEMMRVDTSGNLLVGVLSGAEHRIRKVVAENAGATILNVMGEGAFAVSVFSVTGSQGSTANAAMKVATDQVTNRSIGVGGTINASGADYAEYMLKAAGCGVIAKGDVCGVDADGKLTKTWADAISFVIKSTDPSLVGGDTWAAHLPHKPEQPGAEPIAPAAPLPLAEDADDVAFAAWRDATAAYESQLVAYQIEHPAWQQATNAYAAALADWEDELETARQCVDRIAFCGQVPANVAGEFEVGDYILAAAAGAGIKAVAVAPDEITLPQYMRRIGKVWAIRDGRAWIDVQHG